MSMRYSTIAPDSHSVIFWFGSMMAGRRPFGLISVKGGSLTSSKLTKTVLYSIPRAERIIATFQGFGPISWEYKMIGCILVGLCQYLLVTGEEVV